MKILSKIILLILLLTSGSAFASKYCTTNQPNYTIDLENINIDPGANVGDVVAQSGDISKYIQCSNTSSNSNALLATLLAQSNNLTNVYITIPDRPIIPEQNGKCRVMESGYPGLGIAWYNYNSSTKRWHCFSNNLLQGRELNSHGTQDVIDVIYLVKTGDIATGNFNLNKIFSINETFYPNYSPDNGEIYKITLRGETRISAPICTAVAEKGTGQYQFSVNDALNQSYSTEDWLVNVSCTGYIPNGTIVPFKLESSNGIFSQDSNYFATSDPGLAVEIKYKTDDVNSIQTLNPNERISIPIENNIGSFGLKFIPFIKSGSGVYPLLTNNVLNMKIKASN